MYKNKRIILIVPVFNEKELIGRVVDKAKGTPIDEICVISDGSTDDSPEVARSKGATILFHQKRKGIGAGIRTGIKYALTHNFDIIVVCAGNDKDNPQEVDRLLKPIVEEGYDYIQGSRYMKGGKWGNTPFYRVLLSKVFFLFSSLLVGKRFTDFTNGFRAYTKEFIKDERININQEWLNAYELEPYLHCKAVTLGYRVKEVPVTKIYPTKKTSKIRPFIDWWKIIRPVIYLKLRIKK